MAYEELVKKIIDMKMPEWEACVEKLLYNYKNYYSEDISLDKVVKLVHKEFKSRSIISMYHYNFILKSEIFIKFIKDFSVLR